MQHDNDPALTGGFTSTVRVFQAAARDCAMQMLGNATYIQDHLPEVQMSDALRDRTNSVCTDMIGTKHDVLHELFEVDELIEGSAAATTILARIDGIVQWMWRDVKVMHTVVTDLHAAIAADESAGLAYLLVSESATNILEAFGAATTASKACAVGIQPA